MLGEGGKAFGLAEKLLLDSEASFSKAVELRGLALSLSPQLDRLHTSLSSLLDVLSNYHQAGGKEDCGNKMHIDQVGSEMRRQLSSIPSISVKDVPVKFAAIHDQVQDLHRSLLTPIRPVTDDVWVPQ